MAFGLVDGVSFTASSSGTGSFVFGSSRASFRTLAQAVTDGSLVDGQTVAYLAQDSLSSPIQREWGHGVYTNSTLTVSRATVLGTNAGGTSAVNFTVPPIVSLTALAEDLGTGGTVTASTPALTITQTWNNAAVVFDAPLLLNVTNTASANGSALVDLQIGGSSQFLFTKNSALGGNAAAILWNGGYGGSGVVNITTTAQQILIGREDASPQGVKIGWNPNAWSAGSVIVDSSGGFGWGPTTTISTSAGGDTGFSRRAAGIACLLNPTGLSACGFQVYNMVDTVSGSTTNYERAVFDWTTTPNVLRIGTEASGTGVGRTIRIVGGVDAVSGANVALYNFGVAPATKTTNYTVVDGDQWLIFNGAGSITVTLPAPGSYQGRELSMKTIAAFTVVSASSNVAPRTSATAGTAILAAAAGSWATMVSDGTNWVIMAGA
jgi:hypothetical protein